MSNQMDDKSLSLLPLVNRFFAKQENFDTLVQLLNKKRFSLRVLEYAAFKETEFLKRFDASGLFQTYLESAGKRRFDGFRRHQRFVYKLKDKEVTTNLAQLRFIKFSVERGIYDWLKKGDNAKRVEDEMKKHAAKKKRDTSRGKKRKLVPPTIAVSKKKPTL